MNNEKEKLVLRKLMSMCGIADGSLIFLTLNGGWIKEALITDARLDTDYGGFPPRPREQQQKQSAFRCGKRASQEPGRCSASTLFTAEIITRVGKKRARVVRFITA